MNLRRSLLVSITALLISSLISTVALAAVKSDVWDVRADIKRLKTEVPSLEAFPGVKSITWLNSYKYSLNADGFMEKRHRILIMSGESSASDKPVIHTIPLTQGGVGLSVTEASWYTLSDIKKEGSLNVEKCSEGGLDYLQITLPSANSKRVFAIESISTGVDRFALEDVLMLDGVYPLWEGNVAVTLSDGMTLYWRGEELSEPERKRDGGMLHYTWTVFNQRGWSGSGIIAQKRPTLVFSLRKGILPDLNSISKAAKSIIAPSSTLNLPRNNLLKAGDSIERYMNGMKMPVDAVDNTVRGTPPESGPWTSWERTLIAGKWLERSGYPIDVYWKPVIQADDSFPATEQLWQKPVLVIRDGGKSITYESGQGVAFGKQPPSLYGVVLYGAKGTTVERFNLSKGVATEHKLTQSWKLNLDPNGVASGTMIASLSGAWNDIFSLGDDNDEVLAQIKSKMHFNVPGLDLKVKSVKKDSTGCSVTFDVTAALGITSGSDMLVRMPGSVPKMLEDIPVDDSSYSFNFPFVVEQSVTMSVPKGYTVLTLKKGEQRGDSKALLADDAVFWPRKGQLEANIRWTVRASNVDKSLNANIRDQFMQYLYWTQKTVPLRKK